MTATDIQSQKLALIQNILALEDEQMLLLIRRLLESALVSKERLSEDDFWGSLPEKLRADILDAIRQVDAGTAIPHATAMSEFKQRYSK